MNGEPLPPDHGFPVRLVVPGWYGCVCIKWVTAIDLVGAEERPTSQMLEFAERTHQVGPGGAPTRARDFQPAVMDLAALPIRVEQWQVGELAVFTVWSACDGAASTRGTRLTIRFRHDERFVRVEQSPEPASHDRLEPVGTHLASRDARPLSDRAWSGRPDNPHAAAGSLFLREGSADGTCRRRGFFSHAHRCDRRPASDSGLQLEPEV